MFLYSWLALYQCLCLLLAASEYVVSGGDSQKVEGAKNTILYAVVGIVVAILAYAAVNFVVDQFTDGV